MVTIIGMTDIDEVFRRQGGVAVCNLIPLPDRLAESPMDSEARLVMVDHGLPGSTLQFEIVDRYWRTWRLDFAWPDRQLAVEFDGFAWHSGEDSFRRDGRKRAALTEMGWTMLSVTADDVRRRPREMVPGIETELTRVRAA